MRKVAMILVVTGLILAVSGPAMGAITPAWDSTVYAPIGGTVTVDFAFQTTGNLSNWAIYGGPTTGQPGADPIPPGYQEASLKTPDVFLKRIPYDAYSNLLADPDYYGSYGMTNAQRYDITTVTLLDPGAFGGQAYPFSDNWSRLTSGLSGGVSADITSLVPAGNVGDVYYYAWRIEADVARMDLSNGYGYRLEATDYSSHHNMKLFKVEAIPEPVSIIIWSLIGAIGIGAGLWERRRKAA